MHRKIFLILNTRVFYYCRFILYRENIENIKKASTVILPKDVLVKYVFTFCLDVKIKSPR